MVLASIEVCGLGIGVDMGVVRGARGDGGEGE